MKFPRFVVSLIMLLLVGALWFSERRTASDLREELAALRTDLQGHIDAREHADAENQDLRRQLATQQAVIAQLESRHKTADAADSTESAAAENGAPAETANAPQKGFAQAFGKMFADPEMKKMMRSQQTVAMQMIYGDLAKELNLEPNEARQVMDLLSERQMEMTGAGLKLLTGDKGEADAKTADATTQEIQSKHVEFDQQLENLLGKDRFAQFGEYERSLADRMQLTQYKQALSASGVALEDGQAKELLAIMTNERMQQPATPFDAGNKDVGAALQAMKSPEKISEFAAQQENLNRRVLARVRTVLSPEQTAQFEAFQKQQIELQQMGLKMSQQFLQAK